MTVRAIGVIVTVLLIVLAFSAYTVHEIQRVILFSLGEIKRTDIEPGLHFKFPFINNVVKFDGRVLSLEAEPDRFLTAERKNVTVDFFIKWRIEDTALFYRSFGADESNAYQRLSQVTKDEMRNAFGQRTIQEAVSGERGELMRAVRAEVNKISQQYGMEVLDVRVIRIDLPAEVSESVYDRMRTERALVAKELRAQGREEAARVRATADRRRTVILAEAYRDAQRARGEGDARAAEIYAGAYQEDPEFYNFYRSLNAYMTTFGDKSDVLILDPRGKFFRYFNQSGGAGGRATPSGEQGSDGARGRARR
ncbi:MAG: protease modulator HflC [Gammaproteobacteria bacterium]